MKPTAPIPELSHVPSTITSAWDDLIENRKLNERIRQRYYADRLVIVVAIPKSASSVIGSCVAEMLPASIDKTRGYASYMLNNRDSELRPELVRDFPNGGVLKYHTNPTGANLKVLDLLGVKYIVLLRHPIDQMVAQYCSVFGFDDVVVNNASGWIYDSIIPLRVDTLSPETPDESIKYLIENGYLTSALRWMIDWLRIRDPVRSKVVRYEDFVEDRRAMLNDVSRFIKGADVDDSTFEKSVAISESYSGTRDKTNGSLYPRGWSGKIGIWREYLSEENLNRYAHVVDGFCRNYPDSDMLISLYPSLLDPTGQGSRSPR